MKTYYVRSDETEFIPVRAASRRQACLEWEIESHHPEATLHTLFVERNGQAFPYVWSEGDWIDKRTTIAPQQASEAA